MLYYKNNKWNICPYTVTYKDNGKEIQRYTEDKTWWEKFASKWDHITDLNFEDFTPSSEQQDRLDALNAENVPEGFKSSASTYVEKGELPSDDDGNVLSKFSNLSGEVVEPLELHASTDKETIKADGSDSATVKIELKRGDEHSSEYDDTKWYVPVLGLDGVQRDLLKVVLDEGQGEVSWSTDRPGIYTVRMDMVRPKTSLKMPDNLEIIAE